MSRNKKIGIGIISLGFFLIIGLLVRSNATIAFDSSIQSFVISLRRESLTIIFKMVTYLANWQTIVLFCGLLLVIKRTRVSIGIPISLASSISTIVYKIAKTIYARPRPEIGLYLIDQGGLSFPSGHSMTGFVFYGLLLYFIAKYGKENRAQKALMRYVLVLIFLIGFSRVYLGVHYPTDVLAGWLLGTSMLFSAIVLIERGYPEKFKWSYFK